MRWRLQRLNLFLKRTRAAPELEPAGAVVKRHPESAQASTNVSPDATLADTTTNTTKLESPPKAKESLESKLGARWTVWVGGLALAVGGLFMVKYSIENVLVSPALRLSVAALFGIGLFAAGEAVRRRMGAFASATFQNALIPGVLTAAGSVTLMGSVFAAHMFYGYLSSGTAFSLLALVSLSPLPCHSCTGRRSQASDCLLLL